MFDFADCHNSFLSNFVEEASIAVLKYDAELISSLKLSINAHQMTVIQHQELTHRLVESLNTASYLKYFLEDFLNHIDRIGLLLLAQIDMGPFAHTYQATDVQVRILAFLFGARAHRDRL